MARSSYKLRRVITSVLLLFYGTVGVLGYGLHDLFHVHDAGAHVGEATIACAESPCCPGHHHCHAERPTASHQHHTCNHLHRLVQQQLAERSGTAIDAIDHECSICNFLTQAQEVPLEVIATELVEAVSFGPPVSEVLFPLFLPSEHLARGPPSC